MQAAAAEFHENSAQSRVVQLQNRVMPLEFYEALLSSIESVISQESDWVANLANASSIIFHELRTHRGEDAVNWAGFYILRPSSPSARFHLPANSTGDDSSVDNHGGLELVLGPFQGKLACIRIPVGRGVCGSSIQQKKSLVVRDVHSFKDHIPCDSASKSEIVIPFFATDPRDGTQVFIGVLDIDAPIVNGFDEQDVQGLERVMALLARLCDWTDVIAAMKTNERDLRILKR